MIMLAPERVFPRPPGYGTCIAHLEALSLASAGRPALRQECVHRYQMLKQHALGYLISSAWLIDEAAGRGIRVPDRDFRNTLAQGQAQPSHDAAVADRAFQTAVRRVEANLEQRLAQAVPPITPAQIAAYYRRHLRRYERKERRYFDILEQLPTKAAARKVLKELAGGRKLASMKPYHESLERTSIAKVVPRHRIVTEAIFTAKAHVPTGPEPVNEYSVFEVTRIVPRTVQPLSRVRNQIRRQLAQAARKRSLAGFIARWERKWISRTDCKPGYVVQQCRQYRGIRTRKSTLSFS
jgi:foldase protein PrsA